MTTRMGKGARATRISGLALLTAAAALLFTGGSTSALEPAPQVSVDNARVAVDGKVEVSGSGFRSGDVVALDVCGVPDAAGKFTCRSTGTEVTVPVSGRFTQETVVVEPGGDCPCVVKASTPGLPPAVANLEIATLPVAKQVLSPQLVVDAAEVVGVRGVGAWFTGKADAEMVLDLRNAGVAPAQPTLQLSVTGGDASSEAAAVDDPGMSEVAAGQSATIRVPVEVGSFPGGSYSVDGYVVVGDFYAPVSVPVKVTPWGLYVLGLGALVGLVVLVRRRRRAPETRATAHRAGATVRPAYDRDPQTVPVPVAVVPPVPAPVPAPAAVVPAAAVAQHLVEPFQEQAEEVARPRTGGLSLGSVARAAAEASKAAAAAAIEKAKAAEAEEAEWESSRIRSEVAALDTEARLEALARPDFLRPEPEAQPAPAETASAERERRGRKTRRGEADEAPVGPPRLAETPIDRSRLAGLLDEPTDASGVDEGAAAIDDQDAVTAYLRATAPQVLEPRPAKPQWGDPLSDPLTDPLPVAMPAPLDLPLAHAPAPEPTPVAPEPVAPAPVPAGAMSAALRARAQGAAPVDATVVGEALQAIATHTADNPSRLPDPHEYVPAQRDRRAPKGGKRAAR